MRPRSSSRSRWLFVPALLAWGCGGCDDGTHRSYADARQRLAAISAKSLDESCPEEPACTGILAALAAVPARHADHEEAAALLARVDAARKAKAERAAQLEAVRREVAERVKSGAAPATGDAPLPGADEVPAFLDERNGADGAAGGAGAGEPEGDGDAPGADGPTRGPAGAAPGADDAPDGARRLPADDAGARPVRGAGGDGEEEEAGEAGSGAAALSPPDPASDVLVASAATSRAATPGQPGATLDPFGGGKADSCAGIRVAIARQEDFVRRAAADRDVLGTIENEQDFHAMWLLRKLTRCGEHPEDPDCRPLPAETTLDAATPDPRSITREPGELKAEFDGNDAVVQDPGLVTLQRDLASCEAEARGPTR